MDGQILLKLKELGREFTVLYVEDEKDIRDSMKLVFKQFFHTVYSADNGLEGLAIFKNKPIDIVFTDIEMPGMDGLDMTQKIREISRDIPICIISGFTDVDKFTRAISNGVNHYMLKPIYEDNVITTLYDMLSELKNKIDAKKYHIKLQNEKISKAVKKTAQYFLQSMPSPVFVVDNNQKIVYLNELLTEMLLKKNLEVAIGDDIARIESIFLSNNGEKISFKKIRDNTDNEQRIIFKNENTPFFYMPRKHEIKIPTVDGIGYIIVLNDITIQVKQIRMIEYQKQKLKANKEILEEFLTRNIFTTPEEEKQKVEKILEKTSLETNEMLLRRTHNYKISATNYITTLRDTIADDLEELNELEIDIQSELYEFEYSQKHSTLETIAAIFKLYANQLIRLIEFSDLADAVELTSKYLHELSQEHIDSNGYMIKAAMQSILDDLINWKEHVFITQTTEDIHYLDSSLYNTILELKNSFEQNSAQTESNEVEEDLEFF
ncbi:MAG: response regulator [Campylobacterales bacterium]|nr:response regulator [Campylobacterales bacterium]